MSDARDTNYDGKVSFAEKVKGIFHPHQGTTTSGPIAGGTMPTTAGKMPTTGGIMPTGVVPATGIMPAAGVVPATGIMPAAGVMPTAGVMPAAGVMPTTGVICQDPNCPDNFNSLNRGPISGASGFGGNNFHDSRDLNRDGHISTGERLASGATGFGVKNIHNSLDQNPNVHINKGSGATGFGGSDIPSRDLNRDGHISTGERLASGFGGNNFHDSRDLNRDGHISTGERLASGATGFGGSNFHDSRDLNRAGFDDASRMKLHEEQLAVGKREVGAGAVDIHKRVKEENVQQTVPLAHQELAIERRPLHGLPEPGAQISSQDEMIRVPLYREELVTEKRVVPTEEVIVRKNELMENQTVGATLRSEFVEPRQVSDVRDINHDGHVSMGEKFQGLSMNNASDARDINRDGHVSMGEKLKGAMGTNTTKAARG